MKKMIIMAAIIMPLLIAACSSSDDDNNSSTSYPSIIGTWLMQGGIHEVYTFNADGTYTAFLSKTDYDENKTYKQGKYTYNGTSITLDGAFAETVTWSEDKTKFQWRKYQWNKIK